MRFLMVSMLTLATILACQAPNPADKIENACLAAKIVVETEQTKMRLSMPEEDPILTLDFCRVLPTEGRNKALLLVRATRLEGGAKVEDAFVSRMLLDAEAGWRLIASEPIYLGVMLVPAPSDLADDTALDADLDAGPVVQDQQ